MEEYLTVQELGERIKFSKQSVYNLIYKKKFILGVHYLKPTPKKILFVWSQIEKWLYRSMDETAGSSASNGPNQTEQNQPHERRDHIIKSAQKKARSISAIKI